MDKGFSWFPQDMESPLNGSVKDNGYLQVSSASEDLTRVVIGLSVMSLLEWRVWLVLMASLERLSMNYSRRIGL
ncbi:hypothetical protein JTE90_023324 [Oedothorax gibbosus]|uniref:Uncharacterized protein n=1 Tax=Oedothorax gibbosus TaxID=931172 RepID=A0AAV6VEL7_9ARAC|nr:hypothetical protein JTE90_023324 [Oedothorax gibbosus]